MLEVHVGGWEEIPTIVTKPKIYLLYNDCKLIYVIIVDYGWKWEQQQQRCWNFLLKETGMSDETINIFESKFENLMVCICYWTV